MIRACSDKWITKIAVVIIAMMTVMNFFAGTVFADDTIEVSLAVSADSVNPGDIVIINVSSDTFDHVSEFGPVVIRYDDSQFEFVSVTPADVLSGYEFDIHSDDPGVVSVSADFIEVVDEETGNDVSPFSAEVQTMLFQLALRARADASGDSDVSLDTTGSFTRADGVELIPQNAGSVTVNIARGVSTDASLSSLSIEGITMTPAFDPQVFEYSATVSREVESVNVNAVPNNIQATISVDGADDLTSGENIVSVRVLAQDGIRWREYRIFVNRQENYIPEGSGFVDKYGVTYTFMTIPSNITVPEGFLQTTRTINGYAVPVFAREGVASVLVYVYNGTIEPSLYFYNPVSGIATVYNPESTVVTVGQVLVCSPVPSDVQIPRGFRQGTAVINGVQMSGFVNNDGSFISYMRDDTGNYSFYYYDPDMGRFFEYKSVEQTPARIYRFLFHLFITISVLQSVFIVIMTYAIRKILNNRTNPRPKRV